MHAFSVNKNMDYSAPILFCSLSAPKLQEAVKTVAKPISVAPQKITPVKPATQNKTTMSVKTEVKKQEKKATIIETKKIVAKEKPEPKKIETAKIITPTPVENKISSFAKAPADTAKAIDVTSNIIPAATEKMAETQDSSFDKLRASKEKQLPENAQVSNNFREVEALRRGAQLQKELVHKWQPPIGVSPDCTCDISFFVTKQGTIEQLKMVKSSGVMMFDISARQALFSMKMPQWTYGKPLIISFKQ